MYGRRDLMLFRKRMLVGLSLGALVVASNANAQTDPDLTPPVVQLIDARGVDLATGKYTWSPKGVFIGKSSSGIGDNQGSIERLPGSFYPSPWYWRLISSGSSASVALGQTSVSFSLVNGLYINDAGGGETLTVSNNVWTYTNASGDVIVFDQTMFPDDPSVNYSGSKKPVALANYMSKANGERLKFFYKAWPHNGIDEVMSMVRLQSVSSSFGYLSA